DGGARRLCVHGGSVLVPQEGEPCAGRDGARTPGGRRDDPPQLGSGSPGRRRGRRGGRLRGRGAGTEGVFGRLAGREKNEGLPLDAAILIRYGEIGLKGGNRPAFERQL